MKLVKKWKKNIILNGYAAYRTSHAKKHNEKAINLHMLEDVMGWIAGS